MGVYPRVHEMLSVFGPLVGLRYIIGYVNGALEERRRQKAEGKDLSTVPDFISKFFVTNEEDPKRFGIQHIFGGAATNVVAGTDTTAIALSTICKHLYTHPDVLAQLRKELKEARADGTISDPITFQESQRLKYFHAVVKEAMRLHPSAGLPMWRVVPEGGATISGRYFPAGVSLLLNSPRSKKHLSNTLYFPFSD
jgi:cytochrome P450